MSIAVVFLLVLGCCICAMGRKLAAPLIVGGAFVALTQVFPILQIAAGMMGMGVGRAIGVASLGDDSLPPRLNSEYGGFVVTFVTGGILMATGACSGMLIRLLTPARWWQRSDGTGETEPRAAVEPASTSLGMIVRDLSRQAGAADVRH